MSALTAGSYEIYFVFNLKTPILRSIHLPRGSTSNSAKAFHS